MSFSKDNPQKKTALFYIKLLICPINMGKVSFSLTKLVKMKFVILEKGKFSTLHDVGLDGGLL